MLTFAGSDFFLELKIMFHEMYMQLNAVIFFAIVKGRSSSLQDSDGPGLNVFVSLTVPKSGRFTINLYRAPE